MLGEIQKTLQVTFTAEEVGLLKELLTDEQVVKLAQGYGHAWELALIDFRNILFNA